MRAWRVHEYGAFRDRLRWEEAPDPKVPKDGVVIDVVAAGLNFPDLLSIAGKYQIKAPLPFVPGLEAVGTVCEAGGESRFSIGDRVITNGAWGAFADRMAAPGSFVFRAPEGMPDVEAAGFHITYQTSYFALVHRARMKEGETLLVHGGAGGVGTSAIQLGAALGARVIATASTPEKLEICKRAGAHELINYRDTDFVAAVKELTGGRGADVIYDPVGGDVFDKSSKCIAFSGRLLVIGFASGRIPEIACNRILIKNIAVVGLHWGNYQIHAPEMIHRAHEALCGLYADGAIRPMVARTWPMAELPEALAAIDDRSATGKVAVVR